MISITGDSYNAFFEENQDTELYNVRKRLSRKGTLDGGVSINNFGLAHGDRSFSVYADINIDLESSIKAVFENENNVFLSCFDGFFDGSLENLKIQDGKAFFTFWVKEKIQ